MFKQPKLYVSWFETDQCGKIKEKIAGYFYTISIKCSGLVIGQKWVDLECQTETGKFITLHLPNRDFTILSK